MILNIKIEDSINFCEGFKDTELEIKQAEQLENQQKEINNQKQELEIFKKFIKQYKAEDIFKEFKQNNGLYWYEYRFRGFSPGCQPKGHVDVNNDKGKFGIIAYDRQLTDQEISDYELKPYYNN